jgi:hypothetical protein
MMSEHDFSPLYERYPGLIEKMPEVFTSHQFILELAQANQTAYIEALYSYRHHLHRGVVSPFMAVHAKLAQHLSNYPNMIEQTRKDAPSVDIFGHEGVCSEWRKKIRQISFDFS